MNEVIVQKADKTGVILAHNEYGKSSVKLSKVIRHKADHEIKQMAVDISLQGDFEASYIQGDNSQIVATDSMKNIVYILGSDDPMTDIESFGRRVARHFLDKYAQVSNVIIDIREDLWHRIQEENRGHRHSFVSAGNEKRTASVFGTRELISVDSGIEGLQVLKTTDSAFEGFVRDQYTTLPEVSDRIMATTITAHWLYLSEPEDFSACYHDVRRTILEVFANHKSRAVQETLYAMGVSVLAARKEINEICFTLPNQHHMPFNLKSFNIENRNEIFIPTNEPFGSITGTVKRK